MERYVNLLVLACVFFSYTNSLLAKGNSVKSHSSSKANIENPHKCFDKENKICQFIVALSPPIDVKKAYEMSHHFFRISKKYEIPPQILVLIAKQESDFRLSIVRKVKGLIEIDNKYFPVEVGSDFCMMQINVVNIDIFKLDASRLLKDYAYCIESAAKILKAKKIAYEDRERDWFARYHSSTKSVKEKYYRSIMDRWEKIDPVGSLPYLKMVK